MQLHRYRGGEGGFTLVEMMTIIVIIAALALSIVPFVKDSFIEAKEKTKLTNAKMLNDAALRATIQNLDPQGAGMIGSDEDAAVAWYKENDLLEDKDLSYEGLIYYYGYWYVPKQEDLTNTSLSTNVPLNEAQAALILSKNKATWDELVSYYQGLANSMTGGDLAAYLASYEGGATSLEDLAMKKYGGMKYKEVTDAEVAELVSRISELSFAQAADLIGCIVAHPKMSSAAKGSNLLEISNALNAAIASGNSKMSPEDLNAALLEVAMWAATLG